MIEDIITISLVHCVEKTTSDLRKDAELHILVLKEESLVGTVLLLTLHVLVHDIHIVIKNIWIDASASTLV